MKQVLAIALMLVGAQQAGAAEAAWLGKWEVLESHCSDGSLNRAAIPTLLKSHINLTYEFTPDAFFATINFTDIHVAHGRESCSLRFSSEYQGLPDQIHFLNSTEALSTCREIRPDSMATLLASAISTAEIRVSADQNELLMISTNAEAVCGVGVNALTLLKRIN